MRVNQAASDYTAALRMFTEPQAPPSWQQLKYKPARSINKISPYAKASRPVRAKLSLGKPALGDLNGVFDAITTGAPGRLADATAGRRAGSTPTTSRAFSKALGMEPVRSLFAAVGDKQRAPFEYAREVSTGGVLSSGVSNSLFDGYIDPAAPAAGLQPQPYQPPWLARLFGCNPPPCARAPQSLVWLHDGDGMGGMLDDVKDAVGSITGNVNTRLENLDLALKVIIGLSGVAALTGTIGLFRK